jgi:hypothetical protein
MATIVEAPAEKAMNAPAKNPKTNNFSIESPALVFAMSILVFTTSLGARM